MRPPHGLSGGFARGAFHRPLRRCHGPQTLREHRLHRGPDRGGHGPLRGRLRLLQLRHEHDEGRRLRHAPGRPGGLSPRGSGQRNRLIGIADDNPQHRAGRSPWRRRHGERDASQRHRDLRQHRRSHIRGDAGAERRWRLQGLSRAAHRGGGRHAPQPVGPLQHHTELRQGGHRGGDLRGADRSRTYGQGDRPSVPFRQGVGLLPVFRRQAPGRAGDEDARDGRDIRPAPRADQVRPAPVDGRGRLLRRPLRRFRAGLRRIRRQSEGQRLLLRSRQREHPAGRGRQIALRRIRHTPSFLPKGFSRHRAIPIRHVR